MPTCLTPQNFGHRSATLGCLIVGLATTSLGLHLFAQDSPQWRGVLHDGKAAGFTPPSPWPAALTLKWRTTVGLGDATPALVGSRLYAFGRQGSNEVVRCLNAEDGKETWRYSYGAVAVTGPADKYQGPRSSLAVADGKVVSLGVGGVLTCLDAATGEKVWRKDDLTTNVPMFFTAASPLIEDGRCLVHLGGKDTGMFVSVALASGKVQWQWTEEGPSYSTPTLTTVGGTRQVVLLTEASLTGLSVADGKRLWRVPTPLKPGYWNSASPVADGQMVYYSGQGEGTKAVKIEKQGDAFTVKDQWQNKDLGTVYNTPVIKENRLYGLSDRGHFFCLDALTGQTLWSATNRVSNFGQILDSGAVLVALPEKSGLVVFKPSAERYEETARWAVSATPVYAHPLLAGRRIFVRDGDSVALWVF